MIGRRLNEDVVIGFGAFARDNPGEHVGQGAQVGELRFLLPAALGQLEQKHPEHFLARENWHRIVVLREDRFESGLEQLVALGVSWVWLGLEGKGSQYVKLAGTDSKELVRNLQSHGIRVLGSSIIGLEHHTPENIDEVLGKPVPLDVLNRKLAELADRKG